MKINISVTMPGDHYTQNAEFIIHPDKLSPAEMRKIAIEHFKLVYDTAAELGNRKTGKN